MVEFVFSNGFLSGPGLKLRAVCGAAGITAHKQEGDMATPAGRLKLLRVLYRADRIKPPRCAVPLEPIAPNDGWCDDPTDPAYNQPVTLPYPGRNEPLWRADAIYDIAGLLDWNSSPIIPGAGSAIFLHIATSDHGPTAGCIALAIDDLRICLEAGLTAVRAVS